MIINLKLSINTTVQVEYMNPQAVIDDVSSGIWIRDVDGKLINPLHIVYISNWTPKTHR